MFIKHIMYVLSHGCLLISYKAFFHLCTWFFLSCVLTSSGYKCLFVVYSFFPWEASCYKSCLVSHDVSIYCMMELLTFFRSQYSILDIILLELVHSFPLFLASSWKFLHRWCLSTVLLNCTVSEISSLKVSSYYYSFWILYWTVVTCSSK